MAAITSGQIGALALADVAGGLGVSLDDASWLTTLYLAIQCLTVPLVPLAVAAFGPRPVLLSAAVIMAAASAGEAAGLGAPAAFGFRLVQGAAAGVFPIMTMLLVMRSFPPGKGQREGLLVFAASTSVGLGLAAALAGWLLTNFDSQGPALFQTAWASLLAIGVALGFPTQPANIAPLRAADWRSYVFLAFGAAFVVAGLSQGERRFWFESEIVTLSLVVGSSLLILAALSLWRAKQPFIDLTLLAIPSFGWAIFMALTLRFALLVVAFVIPQYLTRLQGFRPENLADVTLWLLPVHLVAFPLAYALARAFDPRLVLKSGLLAFAAAAFVNVELDPLWAGEQFRASMILLGIGQAFLVFPLLLFATHGLGPKEGATAGTLFNLTRIVGQGAGAAFVATLVTEREKFHSNQIVDHVTAFSDGAEARLNAFGRLFGGVDGDASANALRATATLGRQVADQAFVLAYSDAFLVLGAILSAAAFLVWMLPDIRAGVPSHATAAPAPKTA